MALALAVALWQEIKDQPSIYASHHQPEQAAKQIHDAGQSPIFLTDFISQSVIWTEAHHDFVIAVGTVALALFTLALVAATVGLLISAVVQARDLRRLARATRRSAKIARRALTEYERPWIFLEGAKITMRDSSGWTTTPDGRRVENPRMRNDWFITLKLKNVGRMPAIIQSVIAKIEDKATLSDDPDYGGNIIPLVCPGTIAAGDEAETNSVGPQPGRVGELVFFGRITYRELNGKEHHTGFALAVAPHMPAFVRHPNDAYDYYD